MSNLEQDVEIFSLKTNEQDEYNSFEIDEIQGELELGLSPLARRDLGLHTGHGPRITPWRDKVYGLVVHTTGGSIPAQAIKLGKHPDEHVVRYYVGIRGKPGTGGTHYVNGWKGAEGQQLHQVMNERQVAWGVGHAYLTDKSGNFITDKSTGKKIINKSTDQWTSIKEGRFERDLSPTVLPLWRERWPGCTHSLNLIPYPDDANQTYVHVECVPCVYYGGPKGELITDPVAKPMAPGLRFTKAQHETVARLAWDIAQRHEWPLYTDNLCDKSKKSKQPWWRSSRLLGHEDITPLTRLDNKKACWDPGWLRNDRYFDWDFVYKYIERLQGGNIATTASVSTVSPPSSSSGLYGTFIERFRQLIRAGQENLAVIQAIRNGQTDPNQLTNMVFFARHPELNGRPIRPEDTQRVQEWLQIRDKFVRSTLAQSH